MLTSSEKKKKKKKTVWFEKTIIIEKVFNTYDELILKIE